MAGRVTAHSWRRRAAWLALVAVVLLLHAAVSHQLAQHMIDFNLDRAMPARIEVAYVRELELSAPPAAAPAPPPTVAPPRRAAPPQRAASAPKPRAVPQAEPEPIRETVEAVPRSLEPPPELAGAAEIPPAEPAASEPAPATVAEAPPPASASAPASGAARERFDWPNSTRVNYVLTGNVRGEVAGDAQVQWIRAGTRYQVHLDLNIGPSFAPVMTRRMSSDGELTEAGLSPRRYDEDTTVVLRARRRLTMHFEPDAIVLANGERHERWPGVQDTASQFVQLTYLFTTQPELLRVGGTVEMPLALPRKVDRWIYDVLGEEVLYTPFGALPTFHLKPRRAVQKGGDLVAEIWFSPQLRYLPVRIRIQQDADTFIDLMIARRPELAGP